MRVDVALKRQGNQVEHQPDMLADIIRYPLGTSHASRRQALRSAFGLTDPQLNLANSRQVFIDLAPVARAQAAAELLRIVQHKVQDALLIHLALGSIGRRALAATRGKQPVEYQFRD